MATQQLDVVRFPGCVISLTYDDVSLAVSAVQADNSSPHDAWVQVQNSLLPAVKASGTLAAGAVHTFAVPAGALTLTTATLLGQSVLSVGPWVIASRWPA